MTKRCLDEGILQGYLDGELSPEMIRQAGAHLSECASCAEALATAASEVELLAGAFAPDGNIPVPTAQLRARINTAIAELEGAPEAQPCTTSWSLRALLVPLSALFNLAPQRAAAFATVLAAITFAVLFAVVTRQRPHAPATTEAPGANEVAAVRQPQSDAPPRNIAERENGGDGQVAVNPMHFNEAKIVKTGGARLVKVAPPPPASLPKSSAEETQATRNRDEGEKLLPGEKQYLEVIASLDKNIKAGGDAVLRPAVRVDYERNLALLNRTIEDTRRVARRNPKDTDAVNFLLSAYQNKVDLLNTVAEQAQAATLGR